MGQTLRYHTIDDLPDVKFWWFSEDGNLIDFSTGSPTWTFKIGLPGSSALVTKTSGITGAAGSGVQPTGTPNVTLVWTAGDLASVTPGNYQWQLTARISGKDRTESGPFIVDDVIS